jgi:hypothetical protein
MNEPASLASNQELAQQIAALQRQVFLLLMALIVVTATVVFYLGCQSVIESKDLNAMRPSAVQMIDQYRQHATEIQNFEKQLVSFGQTHPGFQPILKQYGLMANSPTPTAPAP